MPQDPSTDRIEKVAFAVAERVAQETVRAAVSAHSGTCKALDTLERLDKRIDALETQLVGAIHDLRDAIQSLDKKMVGGDYEFKDVNRRLDAQEIKARELSKRIDAYDIAIRNMALKFILGAAGLSAVATTAGLVIAKAL